MASCAQIAGVGQMGPFPNGEHPFASRLGSAMITTASSMSTNSAATGMTMTGSPMPVTAFDTEPITTATSTIVSW